MEVWLSGLKQQFTKLPRGLTSPKVRIFQLPLLYFTINNISDNNKFKVLYKKDLEYVFKYIINKHGRDFITGNLFRRL